MTSAMMDKFEKYWNEIHGETSVATRHVTTVVPSATCRATTPVTNRASPLNGGLCAVVEESALFHQDLACSKSHKSLLVATITDSSVKLLCRREWRPREQA
ncbi:hypothetical protein L484_009040 [Morus notabilis]|uniref:Uncharacterized protein n=1 Tax=Morus notabilis TaxID=981085 RepID=W9RB59_9ROSA|nr:hypothetical protein L484_009040 [Morus notabilis]